ncbi:amino acid adenylation domain-containing protein [Streptomyces sp. NBC_00190]|uniref:amino acid adenylation domain-containing protein n=1 Tax=Streptomyces sp. NBC_00190 TaxID=2903634 RepID=UPI002E2BBF01|nr:amino acid adenylation domain-containing protein [Streptomyces sp. NBC_00190]
MGTPTDADPHRGAAIATAIPRWRREPLHADTPTTEYACDVPAALASGLEALADRLGVPVASLLLAVHAKVLASLSGEQDVLTGYIDPGSPTDTDTDSDTAPEPAPVLVAVADGGWEQLVQAARQAVGQPTLPRGLYEVVLDLSALTHEQPLRTLEFEESIVLRVAFCGASEGMCLRLAGDPGVLDLSYAQRIAGYLMTALERLVADSTAEHHTRNLLSADEFAYQIDGLAGPSREFPNRRAHELIEECVRRHPDRIAAVHAGTTWTYAELNRRTNRIAHALLNRGLRSEDVVAVVTERNLDWLAAALAVFKAGGVYLPIEPHFPAARIGAMLARSECRFVLTEAGSTTTLDEALVAYQPAAYLLIDDAVDGAVDTDPGIPVGPGQLAYVYFTSGSTGEPKGAMCEHAGMLNHLLAKIEDLDIRPGQVVAQTAPQCFDISLWQLISGLLVGARTLIVGQREILDIRRYVDTLVDGGVEVLQVVPSYLEVMLSHLEEEPRPLGRLRSVSTTGEALKKELTERWFAAFPDIKLVNAYGLTETSDDTNHEVMDRVPVHERVPLGSAVRNVRVYVVDERTEPVPLGAPGEIVFSGVCVGRGYINDPERTATAFGTDPHRVGERLYRSGDFGRWLPEGTLEFLGRRDAQIKIRGFRIEIGEIENHLVRVDGVRDSAVVVAQSADQEEYLVAFYASDAPLDPDLLRRSLGESLPAYMVPQLFHHRGALPLTANGKIDKKTLRREAAAPAAPPAGVPDPGRPTDFGADWTASELRLAEVWARVLNIPLADITRDMNFFESGGTSLSAVRVGAALGGAARLEDIIGRADLASLAVAIDEHVQQAEKQEEKKEENA